MRNGKTPCQKWNKACSKRLYVQNLKAIRGYINAITWDAVTVTASAALRSTGTYEVDYGP